MPKKMLQVEVESSGYDIIEHMTKIIVAAKAAGGFSPTAIPADIAVLVSELPGLVASAQLVKGDIAEDKVEFVHGALEAALDLYAAVKS